MSVVGTAKELWEDQKTDYQGGVWTATRAWRVDVTLRSDREDTVSTASGLPAYGELHPGAIAAPMYATTISYSHFAPKTPLSWKVSAGYTSDRGLSATDAAADEDLVSFDSEIYQELVSIDNDGKAILNSAGDPFIDPPPTRDAGLLIASVQTNQSGIPSWFLAYQNATNSVPFNIEGLSVATGQGKATRFRAGARQKRGSSTFYPINFEVHLKKEGWKLEPLDQGFRERNANGEMVRIRSKGDREFVTSPVALDGAGKRLDNPTPQNAKYGDFTVQNELAFSVLPGIS